MKNNILTKEQFSFLIGIGFSKEQLIDLINTGLTYEELINVNEDGLTFDHLINTIIEDYDRASFIQQDDSITVIGKHFSFNIQFNIETLLGDLTNDQEERELLLETLESFFNEDIDLSNHIDENIKNILIHLIYNKYFC